MSQNNTDGWKPILRFEFAQMNFLGNFYILLMTLGNIFYEIKNCRHLGIEYHWNGDMALLNSST